jgi:hypothetical protein
VLIDEGEFIGKTGVCQEVSYYISIVVDQIDSAYKLTQYWTYGKFINVL